MSDAFRDWLTQELEKRHWSQRELARRSGVSQSAISLVMRGNAPSADFCIAVAQAFGESYWKVLHLAGVIPPLGEDDPILAEILDIGRSLTPEQREKLLEFAQFLRR